MQSPMMVHMRLNWLIAIVLTILTFSLTGNADAQSPALCNDWNFVEDALIRADFGDYRYQANCKIINPRRTGILIPDAEVTAMVNVFFPERDMNFERGGVICISGNNELLFTTGPDAVAQPLTLYRVPAWPGYICATVYETGYVLRTRQPSNVPAIRPPSPPVAQSQCVVTTTNRLRVRVDPNTTSRILGVLPANAELLSDQRIEVNRQWWYHVGVFAPVTAEAGWVSGDYLTFVGDCGYVCEQDAAGTRIICRIR